MKIRNGCRFMLLSFFAAAVVAQSVFVTVAADSYSVYNEKNSTAEKASEVISVNAAEFVSGTGNFSAENGAVSTDGSGTLNYTLDVPSDSLYNIYLTYAAVDANSSNIKVGVMFDGAYPFDEAKEMSFSTAWNNETQEFSVDSNGNQLTPKQVMVKDYFSHLAEDVTGVSVRPYEVLLTAGKHTLSLVGCGIGFKVKSIKLVPPEVDSTYEEYYKQHGGKTAVKAEPIVLEGENAINKTSYAIIPKSDTLDASVTPSNAKTTCLNYIGGTSWQSPGEAISWSFNVDHDGFYKLSFHYKQSDNINRSSYRQLTVDGRTPFAEAREISFNYSTKWSFFEFGDGKEPYLIWLERGQHILSLKVTLGEAISSYYSRLSDIADNLNSIYLNMIKITGASPDASRDYELFKQIPDLQDSLQQNHDCLETLITDIVKNDGGKISEMAAALKNMSRVLKNMLDKPYSAQDYIKNFFSAYSTLSTWLQDMKESPLSIDSLTLSSKEFVASSKISVFKKFKYRFSRFLTSFTTDYDNISNSKGNNSITVWSNLGRDQASALDLMIKQDFTKKTGIGVNLKIVSASLINGLLSDSYPDVMLGMSRTDPVNYGIRNALYDLKNFDDYDEVIQRFQKGADVPYTYGGSAYALPETQTFNVMFYRTDILAELNLTPPKTWDEFIKASVAVQRNNMEVYIPYTTIASAGTVNLGIGSIGLFPTFMLQNKLSLYNEEETATALTTPEAIGVFDYWVKMYTEYKIQKTADFYNRFRMGIMPLGIASYSTYFNFVQMAPEIQGKYSMAFVPGMSSTGSNVVAAGGTACAVINKSKKHNESWKFLKWFTSADAQTEYSRRVESILGLVGRITTANVEALNNMEWETDQLNIINEQWKRVQEIPEIPGSYYLIRSVDQAYWSVVTDSKNSKDALAQWTASADAEIMRKFKEYGKK